MKHFSKNLLQLIICTALVVVLAGCRNLSHPTVGINDDESLAGSFIRYARGFSVTQHDDIAEVVIFNPWHRNDTLAHFFVVSKSAVLSDIDSQKLVVPTPLDRIIALSATQWGPLITLGEVGRIVGVSEGRFINDTLVRRLLNEGKLTDVGGEERYDVEKMLRLEPGAVFYSPNPTGVPAQLAYTRMNLIPWPDYLENHPLGRAEWVKLLGLLTGKDVEASRLFKHIETEYHSLKQLAASAKERPTVFSDKAFAGQWYVPCGQSYLATLLADAGSDYVFRSLEGEASVPLDIEAIFSKAAHAQYWRIAQAAPEGYSYPQILAENEFYGTFDAFKNHRIIFCNTAKTAYFEKGNLEPHQMLADLIAIFHPQLLPDHQPVFYQLLEP